MSQYKSGNIDAADGIQIGGPFVLTFLAPGGNPEVRQFHGGNTYEERIGPLIHGFGPGGFNGQYFIPPGAALTQKPGGPHVAFSGFVP